MKAVHHVQHLMSHTKYAIQIQVLLTRLLCSQTQFIQPWLQSAAEKLTPQIQADLGSPKTMVRIMANSAARVQRTASSTVLVLLKPVPCRISNCVCRACRSVSWIWGCFSHCKTETENLDRASGCATVTLEHARHKRPRRLRTGLHNSPPDIESRLASTDICFVVGLTGPTAGPHCLLPEADTLPHQESRTS